MDDARLHTLHEPLVRVWRGGALESVHLGMLLVHARGQVIECLGHPEAPVFLRSTSKPQQALVAVTSGAVDRFGLDDEMLALGTGSHSGTREHEAVLRRLLEAIDVPASALRCGAHWPFDGRARAAARASLSAPRVGFANCSGKHALMLAACKALGAPLETYLDPDHPVQRTIHGHLAQLAGVSPEDVAVMMDGCSAPTFRLGLHAGARAMAQLAEPQGLDDALHAAVLRVRDAMLAHPAMVGGPGRFDTQLMQAAPGTLISKAGAEGTLGLSVPGAGAGVILTALDGADRGYRLAALTCLVRHGWLAKEAAAAVAASQCAPVLRNHAGAEVGRVEAWPFPDEPTF